MAVAAHVSGRGEALDVDARVADPLHERQPLACVTVPDGYGNWSGLLAIGGPAGSWGAPVPNLSPWSDLPGPWGGANKSAVTLDGESVARMADPASPKSRPGSDRDGLDSLAVRRRRVAGVRGAGRAIAASAKP